MTPEKRRGPAAVTFGLFERAENARSLSRRD